MDYEVKSYTKFLEIQSLEHILVKSCDSSHCVATEVLATMICMTVCHGIKIKVAATPKGW